MPIRQTPRYAERKLLMEGVYARLRQREVAAALETIERNWPYRVSVPDIGDRVVLHAGEPSERRGVLVDRGQEFDIIRLAPEYHIYYPADNVSITAITAHPDSVVRETV